MPPKDKPIQRDKLAWDWAKSTNPENITEDNVLSAYRLNTKRCNHISNRRNCRGNPLCLLGIGERDWLLDRPDSAWHDIEDPELERRSKDSFVGLKNLGATCYVNTLLQVWFHNLDFRSVIYKYMDESEDGPSIETTDRSQLPKSICGNIQYMFALLQKSERRFVDPTPFIQSMGLSTTQQQDAQEFSKLFMSLLQEKLLTQRLPEVRNFVQTQFCGEYAYFTQCQICKSVISRPSNFYELDLNIKGHKDINQCLLEFLHEEKLEGDNQYMCQHCNKKQNAVRKIVLKQLPKVLNLQLLRFVFDRQTGQKKKLSNFIQFPEHLDMTPFINSRNEATNQYELQAVLIHRGPTAYSGHYVAHIKDSCSKCWYKFNDEEIEKMKGKDLNLGAEEEIELVDDNAVSTSTAKQSGKKRAVKGHHTSKNAYMLVYHLKDQENQGREANDVPVVPEVPDHLVDLVKRDNINFNEWMKDMIKMRDENISRGIEKQEEIRHLYWMLSSDADNNCEWISHEWLCNWLSDHKPRKKINNSMFLCPHDRLDPDKVIKLKWINQKAADELYSDFSGGPRLGRESLCWDCVREQCRSIRIKVQLAEDQQFITTALKSAITDSEVHYWVGKVSLRQWKRLASEFIMKESLSDTNGHRGSVSSELSTPDDIQESRSNNSRNIKKNGDIGESQECTKNAESGGASTSGFINCEKRTNDVNTGHTSEVNDSQKPTMSANDCQKDVTLDTPVENRKDLVPTKSDENKQNYVEFNTEILCDHGNLSIDEGCRRLISTQIWTRLKVYFPTAPEFQSTVSVCKYCQCAEMRVAEERDTNIEKATLMKSNLSDLYSNKGCRPDLNNVTQPVYVVTKTYIDHWRRFLRHPGRVEPALTVVNSVLLCEHRRLLINPVDVVMSNPDLQICLLFEEEWRFLRQFVDVDVEISAVSLKEDNSDKNRLLMFPEICDECLAMRIDNSELVKRDFDNKRIYVQKLLGNNVECDDMSNSSADVDFERNTAKKRKTEPELPTVNQRSSSPSSSIRRSSRHRKVRGEKDVIVSSRNTLRDLKLQLMKMFSVAPFDQHLYLGSRKLSDEKATLHSLGILPDCVLKLQVDQPSETAFMFADVITSTQPEEGFKGTGLVKTSTT